MEKRLKFRVWIDNSWHYWGFVNGHEFKPVPNLTYLHDNITLADLEGLSDRFTGYIDAAGKEIYENDYIEYVKANAPRKVVFDNMRGWGKELTSGYRMFPLFDMGQETAHHFKVIGDLHTVGIGTRI